MSQGNILTDRFDRALLYASHVHGGQVRKGTSTPYVAHLLAVAATVLEYGGDEDLAIAALLHDSVEDQGGKGRLEDVRSRFGERVARIVEACSDSLADTAKGERKAHWQERKEAYMANLLQADEDILRVSLADKVHNARSILRDLRKPEIGEKVWAPANRKRRRYGTTAALPNGSANGCLVNCRMSCVKSLRCWKNRANRRAKKRQGATAGDLHDGPDRLHHHRDHSRGNLSDPDRADCALVLGVVLFRPPYFSLFARPISGRSARALEPQRSVSGGVRTA